MVLNGPFGGDRITATYVRPEKLSISSSTKSIRIIENLLLQILLELRRIETFRKRSILETE